MPTNTAKDPDDFFCCVKDLFDCHDTWLCDKFNCLKKKISFMQILIICVGVHRYIFNK